MIRAVAFAAAMLALLAMAAPVTAQQPQPDEGEAPPRDRVITLVVYGEDACPESTGDAIVVCARKPESERYRIPKPLREKAAPAGGPGWSSQVAEMESAGRALMPGSCNAIGSYGFTGCTAAMLRQWFAERRMKESENIP